MTCMARVRNKFFGCAITLVFFPTPLLLHLANHNWQPFKFLSELIFCSWLAMIFTSLLFMIAG